MIGDSKVVIDWLKFYTSLNTSLLDQRMIRVMDLIRIFRVISIDHVHWELNSKVGILSKMRVNLQLGQIHYEEHLQGEMLVNY